MAFHVSQNLVTKLLGLPYFNKLKHMQLYTQLNFS